VLSRSGGRDSIDHPPNGRDDLANAVAGALVAAGGQREPPLLSIARREMAKAAAQRQALPPGRSIGW